MRIVVGSCFRNSTPEYVFNYRTKIELLQAVAKSRGDRLDLVSVWGDSSPETPRVLGAELASLGLPSWKLVDRTHGRGSFGSTTLYTRLAGFSHAVNGVFESIEPDVDVVIYVESDLEWKASTLYRLIDQLRPGVDIIAPMTFVAAGVQSFIGKSDGNMFYDIWGCRALDGSPFNSYAPYMEGTLHPDKLTELSTVGSCVVMRGEVARKCRCSLDESIVGFCKNARQNGYSVWIDARERIEQS